MSLQFIGLNRHTGTGRLYHFPRFFWGSLMITWYAPEVDSVRNSPLIACMITQLVNGSHNISMPGSVLFSQMQLSFLAL